jgi:hypothetical protein
MHLIHFSAEFTLNIGFLFLRSVTFAATVIVSWMFLLSLAQPSQLTVTWAWSIIACVVLLLIFKRAHAQWIASIKELKDFLEKCHKAIPPGSYLPPIYDGDETYWFAHKQAGVVSVIISKDGEDLSTVIKIDQIGFSASRRDLDGFFVLPDDEDMNLGYHSGYEYPAELNSRSMIARLHRALTLRHDRAYN